MNIELEDHIRVRAYYIWEMEGRPEGRHLDHWVRASAEYNDAPALVVVEKKRAAKTSAPRVAKPKVAPAKAAAPKVAASKVTKVAKVATVAAIAAPAKPRRSARSAQITLN